MTSFRAFVMILVASIGISGCGETFVDPFENPEGIFSIYGFLDPLTTTQKIRVVEVSRAPSVIVDPSSPEARIDAEVTTIDMTTGQRTRWNHSLERLDDDTYGHVFIADLLLTSKRRYRLEVVRSDGRMASAETTIPAVTGSNLTFREGVVMESDPRIVHQDVTIAEVTSPWNIQVVYTLQVAPFFVTRVFVPYGRAGQMTDSGGWQLRLNLSEDQVLVRERYEELASQAGFEVRPPHGILAVGVQMRLLDPGWVIPEGEVDPDVLAQPGSDSNIENGYGYFGSLGLFIEEWDTDGLSRDLGYPI